MLRLCVRPFLRKQRRRINQDGTVDLANFDHQFDTADLVAVFVSAKYETDRTAKWHEGDWNCDGMFDSADLVRAFQYGWTPM